MRFPEPRDPTAIYVIRSCEGRPLRPGEPDAPTYDELRRDIGALLRAAGIHGFEPYARRH